ncbi:MAG TPA: hypothetical protein VIF62_15295, partial [Labilithrix sp.]
MARIDRILAIVVDQGANELRVGTDREPVMLAYGARKKLSLPKTPDDMLRDLLGELLSADTEAQLRANAAGRIEVDYDAGELGHFRTTLVAREGGIDATFVRSTKAAATSATRIAAPASERAIAIATPHAAAPAPATARGSESLEALVARAAALRASDIHLAEHEPPFTRVDGALQMLDGSAIEDFAALLGLDDDVLARVRKGRALDLAIDGMRVHVYATTSGLA